MDTKQALAHEALSAYEENERARIARRASVSGPSEPAAPSGALGVARGSKAVSSACSFVVLGGAELSAAQEALCLCVQLLRGWHSDGTVWSLHDTEVERRICALQQRLEVPAGRTLADKWNERAVELNEWANRAYDDADYRWAHVYRLKAQSLDDCADELRRHMGLTSPAPAASNIKMTDADLPDVRTPDGRT